MALEPNPFVGPRPLTDHDPLFGRDREVAELRHLLTAERLVLLHSPSGAGKSSLIQAGLVPELRRRFDCWTPTRVNQEPPAGLMVTNRYVFSALVGFEEGLPKDSRRPLEELAGLTLCGYAELRERMGNRLLIFDQFEEILRVAPNDLEGQREFFRQLGELLERREIWALFAIREDYLAPLLPYAGKLPTHLRARYRLDLLTTSQAEVAIREIAWSGGRDSAPAAVRKLVENLAAVRVQNPDGSYQEDTVTGAYVEPMQLQVVCLRLWEEMPEADRSIDLEDVARYGDVTKALGEYYDRCVGRQAGGDLKLEREIRRWFDTRLINAAGMRGQVQRGPGMSGGLANTVIEALERTHLVRPENGRGLTWYELSHDRLIEPVRTANAAWELEHLDRIQKQALLWVEQKKAQGLLLDSAQMEEGRAWLERNRGTATEEEVAFLAASEERMAAAEREAAQQRAIARSLWRVRVMLAGAVVCLGVAGWQWWEAEGEKRRSERAEAVAVISERRAMDDKDAARAAKYREEEARGGEKEQRERAEGETRRAQENERQARIALAGNMIQNAERVPEEEPGQALAWLAKALRIDPESFPAKVKIAGLLRERRWWTPAVWVPVEGRMRAMALSRNGARLAVAGEGEVRVWDVRGTRPVAVGQIPTAEVELVTLDETGAQLAAVERSGTVKVWQVDKGAVATGKLPKEHSDFTSGTRPIWIAFTDEGKHMELAWANGGSEVWATATVAPEEKPPAEAADGREEAVSGNGRTYLYRPGRGTGLVAWRKENGRWLRVRLEPAGGAARVAVSENGESVAVWNGNNRLQVWSSVLGPWAPREFAVAGDARSLRFAGKFLILALGDRFWVWGGSLSQPVERARPSALEGAIFPQSESVALVVEGNEVKEWWWRGGPSQSARWDIDADIFGDVVAFGAAGGTVAKHKGGGVEVRRVQGAGYEAGTVTIESPGPHVDSVVEAGTGAVIQVGADGVIRHWNPLTGKMTKTIRLGGKLNWGTLSDDGKWLAGRLAGQRLQVWNAANGATVGGPYLDLDESQSPALFSEDGKRFVVRNGGKMVMVEVATGGRIGPGFQLLPLRRDRWMLSADGSRMVSNARPNGEASGGGRRVLTVHVATGKKEEIPAGNVTLPRRPGLSRASGRLVTLAERRVIDFTTGALIGGTIPGVGDIPLNGAGSIALIQKNSEGPSLWDVDGSRVIWRITHPLGLDSVSPLWLSEDAGTAVLPGANAILIWQTRMDGGGEEETKRLIELAEAMGSYRVNEQGVMERMDDAVHVMGALRDWAAKAPDKPGTVAWYIRRYWR